MNLKKERGVERGRKNKYAERVFEMSMKRGGGVFETNMKREGAGWETK